MANRTIQDVIDISRELLKDEDSGEYRYSDASLLRAFNVGITVVFDKRPDAMSSIYDGIPVYTADDLDKEFPISLNFFNPMVFFITAYAELRNDEFTDDSRATALMNKFTKDIIGNPYGAA